MKEIPSALLQELRQLKGFDESSFIAAHQQSAVTSVRLHSLKPSGAFAGNERVVWCAEGRYLPERPIFTIDPLYHAGAYYVQEASSMFLDYMLRQLLAGKTNLRVLDLCAAPGGKSTLIASLLDRDSLLISNEVIRTRASILEENIVRWGYANNWVSCNDPRDFTKLEGYFDVIVVDAPCSGSGLFRKDEKAMDEWSEGNVTLCSQRQQRILADIWPALKDGGILVYATCSYSPQEDEEILDWMADTYEVESLGVDTIADAGITTSLSTKGFTGYRFSPDKTKGEGFFIAALQKREVTNAPRTEKLKPLNNKKIAEQAGGLLTDAPFSFFQSDSENYNAINAGHEADLQLLSKTLYLRKKGLQLGMPSAKEWLPSHDIAMSIDKSNAIRCIEVDKQNALHFLKKEELQINGMDKGWYMLTYQGLGLGWVKSLGSRYNNYLPKHWRIRMEIPDTDRA